MILVNIFLLLAVCVLIISHKKKLKEKKNLLKKLKQDLSQAHFRSEENLIMPMGKLPQGTKTIFSRLLK